MAIAKYAQVKHYIIEQIEQGVWLAHDKLPSENELADLFCCSRMTARRALTELCDTGALVRAQGQGTFVAELKSQSSMMAIRNIADEIKARGHGYCVQQLQLHQVAADKVIAIALGLEVGAPVFFSLLVHLEQGVPLQMEQRFINPQLVPEYLTQNFQTQTPHEYLSKVAPLTEAQHTIEAVLASEQAQQLLQIKDCEPCLQITRKTWSSQGVVSFAILMHPGSRFRLGGHLTF